MSDTRVTIDRSTREDVLALTKLALTEDIGSHELENAIDCTTLAVVPGEVSASATLVARDIGVVSGVEIVKTAIQEFAPDLQLAQHCGDGDLIESQQPIATFSGEAQKILMMERTCLNFMCRLSGIATLTARFVEKVKGTRAEIFDTRKTLPGWRRLEKYAVACGGGRNHRMGLFDAIMIKDNHLAMYGNLIDNHQLSVSQAVELARKWIEDNFQVLPHGKKTVVQIEVDTLEQLKIALPASPDIVLLDNMDPAKLTKAVKLRDETNRAVLLEASGGVDLETVSEIGQTGVERISIGALTHSAPNFDIGLDWELDANHGDGKTKDS